LIGEKLLILMLFFEKFKKLIEDTYVLNGNNRVNIVAHSMGCIHTTQFLNQQDWKDKFIGSFIAIAAPWSGAPKALRAIISGDNFDIEINEWLPLVEKLRVRPMLRRSGGTVFLLPEVAFYNDKELVRTPNRVYTARDYYQLFEDLGTTVPTKDIFDTTDGVMRSLDPPAVELHCLYGINEPTEDSYLYNNGWDKDPDISYSINGDGTVPGFSLRRCKDFAARQTQRVQVIEFDLNIEDQHTSILSDKDLIQYIIDVVTKVK